MESRHQGETHWRHDARQHRPQPSAVEWAVAAKCNSSGCEALVVVGLQAAPAVPEWLGRSAMHVRDENIEVDVPTGTNHQRHGSIWQAAMGDRKQDVFVFRFKLEGDVASAPRERELARRIKFSDAALHALLIGKARWPLPRRAGQLVVAPDEFELGADLQIHLTGGEPLTTEIAFGDIGPDALDFTGQKSLDLERRRLDQRPVAFLVSYGGDVFDPFFVGGFFCERSARSRFSRTSRWLVQNRS
jgi:hypothetical protein